MFRLLTVLVLATALSSVAGGQQERAKRPANGPKRAGPQGEQLVRLLQRADVNRNDEVTREELAQVAPRLARQGFRRLDTNKDGVISEQDRKDRRMRNGPTPAQVRAADANKDGQWSWEELRTVAPNLNAQVFGQADKSGDGLLNRQELQALRRQADQRNTNARRGNPRGNAAAQIRRDAIAKLLQSDANGDGQVSFDELLAAKPGYPREAFNRNDRNNDGVLSQHDRP